MKLANYQRQMVYVWLCLAAVVSAAMLWYSRGKQASIVDVPSDNTIQEVQMPRPFSVWPKEISPRQWQILGLSVKQSKVAYNFCQKVKFKTYADLLKSYVIDTAIMQRLMPYLRLDLAVQDVSKSVPYRYTKYKRAKRRPSEKLNKFKSYRKTTLNSIGFYQLITILDTPITRQFLKYRRLLGGFYDIGQLQELNGFSTADIQRIKEKIVEDTLSVTPISVNEAPFKSLLRHPYLDYEQVKSIVQYREKMKPLETHTELRHVLQLDKVKYEKIKPYIKFKTD